MLSSKLKIFVVLTLVLLILGVSVVAAQSVTIRYAHFQPAALDQPKHAAALAFKYYVETNTNQEVEVIIYPASQLGDAPTVLEGLQLGSIQLGVVHDGPIAGVYSPAMVYNIPYLFNDQAEAWKIFDSEFTKKLGEAMREETGIRLMALADNGIRNFTYNGREVRWPKDMKGLKIRVMPSPLFETLVRSLGASPSAITWPELPAALQQGVVDGQENGVTNILAASLYQHQKYITLDGHVYSYHAYLMNDAFFRNQLTEEQQKVVEKGIEIAKWIHRGMTAAQDMNVTTILGSVGMTVIPLTPEQVQAFREAAQPPVIEWLKSEVGADWVDGLLEEIEKIRSDN